MAALDPMKSRVMEFVAAFVIVAFTAMEAFMTAAPYFGLSPGSADVATLAQQQTLVQTIMVAIISFLFGASVGTQKKDDALATQASTIATAQAALTPTPATPDVVLPAGAEVKVAAADPPKP
jgi:hypothetical protein